MQKTIKTAALAALVLAAGSMPAKAEAAEKMENTKNPDAEKRFNQLSAERAVLYARVSEQEQKEKNLWKNPEFTSEEIEGLRNKLAVLEMEAAKVRKELRDKVAQLPEVGEILRAYQRDRKKLQELSEQRKEMRERR